MLIEGLKAKMTQRTVLHRPDADGWLPERISLEGVYPESWCCVDCGIDTAPGCPNRADAEATMNAVSNDKGVSLHIDENSEIYTVKQSVWRDAGMADLGGCLCIGCLEKRLGRILRPKDFQRHHPFSELPGTPRLLNRRGAA